MTKARWPAATSVTTSGQVPTVGSGPICASSSKRRVPVTTRCRPAGALRRSETSRSAWKTWPRVRGIGVAVISRTWGVRPFPASASRWATPKRCCSSMTARARSANTVPAESRACVPTTMRPLVRPSGPGPAGGEASTTWAACRSAAEREAVRSSTRWPSGSRSPRRVAACWRASRSVGARRAPWAPLSATKARARAATAVLPDPTSPCSSRSIGRGPARSARIAVDRRALVVGEAGRRRLATPDKGGRDGVFDDRLGRPEAVVRHDHAGSGQAAPLPVARDHADLEGQQLVEGEAVHGRRVGAEVVRVVGLLERLGQRWQRHALAARRLGQQRRVEVVGVVAADHVQRPAHRRPQGGRRDPFRQAVHRARCGRRAASLRRPARSRAPGIAAASHGRRPARRRRSRRPPSAGAR